VQQLEQQTQKVTEYAQSIDKTKSEKDATAQPPQVISVRFSQYTVLMRQLLITSPSLFETDAFTRAQAAVTDALTKELAMIKEHPEFVNEFKAVLTPALTDFTEQAKKSKAPKAMIAAFTTQLQTMQSEVAKIQPPTAPEKKERVIEATPANVKSIAQSIQKTERKFADALEKLADIAQKMEQKQLDSSEMPEHHLRTERIGVYRAAVTHLLRQESAPKPTLSVAQVSASFKLLQNTVQQERTIVAQSIKDASKIKEFLTTLLKQGVDPIKTSIGASHGKIPRMAPKHKALWEPVLNSAYTFFTEEYKKLLPETK